MPSLRARALVSAVIFNLVLRAALPLGLCLPLLRVSADTPITPNASPETRSLFAFLEDTRGKKIISGQQEGWRGTNALGFELTYIREISGELPAILSMDMAPYTRPGNRKAPPHTVVNQAIDWYSNRRGIVSLCWHWAAPMNTPAFYSTETSFRPGRAVVPGTPENAAAMKDIDLIAAELKLLRDAHVPVLWRPLHEANGRWFWWGADGPEPLKALWRMVFERLAVHHGLNNLIWVFSPGAGIDLGDWYPGDAWVDIIAPDHYPMDGNDGPARSIFDEMVALGGGTKLVGFGENGPIPAPDALVAEKADWLFFITWAGKVLTDRNSKEAIRKAYTHPRVLTLAELPDLRRYPFATAGRARKLAFPAAPAPLAVGSPGQRPVVVAVQDDRGRTVRDSRHRVTLALAGIAAGATLRGTQTVEIVRGLAVFPDAEVTAPGGNFTFRAEARGLEAAVSAPFPVGPGAGILQESWTNSAIASLSGLAVTKLPPAESRVLGRAFAAPVRFATNFCARYRGWVHPPASGDYVFWIANDGTSELWVSTDELPANRRKVAEILPATPYAKWPHTHEAQSAPLRMEAGKRYYIEALHRQAAGSAHFSVRWRRPDAVEESPIPGARLAALQDQNAFPPPAANVQN